MMMMIIQLHFYEEKLIQTFKKRLLKSIPNKNSKTEWLSIHEYSCFSEDHSM